jgi:hypothetical protein
MRGDDSYKNWIDGIRYDVLLAASTQ